MFYGKVALVGSTVRVRRVNGNLKKKGEIDLSDRPATTKNMIQTIG